MNYTVNTELRQIEIISRTKNVQIIKEFDLIEYKFLPNTQDKFEIELILLDVENEEGETETKAFGRRIGYDSWLMGFDPNDYNLEVIDNA